MATRIRKRGEEGDGYMALKNVNKTEDDAVADDTLVVAPKRRRRANEEPEIKIGTADMDHAKRLSAGDASTCLLTLDVQFRMLVNALAIPQIRALCRG